jgi:hypothetical protein
VKQKGQIEQRGVNKGFSNDEVSSLLKLGDFGPLD